MAGLLRLELLTPQGDLVQAQTYNKFFTIHGITMIFFFLIRRSRGVGNFLVPIMIGARDLAFPRSTYCRGMCTPWGGVHHRRHVTGGVDTGWTFYTPYSSTYANTNVILTALGSSLRLLVDPHRLNFVVTIHKMRAPGLTWFRFRCSSGALRHQPHHAPGHPRRRHHHPPVALERGLGIGSSIRPSGVIRCSSSIYFGSIPTRPCTS